MTKLTLIKHRMQPNWRSGNVSSARCGAKKPIHWKICNDLVHWKWEWQCTVDLLDSVPCHIFAAGHAPGAALDKTPKALLLSKCVDAKHIKTFEQVVTISTWCHLEWTSFKDSLTLFKCKKTHSLLRRQGVVETSTNMLYLYWRTENIGAALESLKIPLVPLSLPCEASPQTSKVSCRFAKKRGWATQRWHGWNVQISNCAVKKRS